MPKLPSDKKKITAEEWEQVKADAEAAKEILEGPQFAFLRKYLDSAKNSILQTFATEAINDACIQTNIGDATKVVQYPAKKEYSHLAGQYKFIEQLLRDLTTISKFPEDARKLMKQNRLELEESSEIKK